MAVEQRIPEFDLKKFRDLHHLGVDKTEYLARRCYPGVEIRREDVKRIVEGCTQCLSIDPAPVRWNVGHLGVARNWDRLACDVTHYRGDIYLTVIDCGPSRFSIWKKVTDERSGEVVEKLDEIFRERGSPRQLLLDNGASFRSEAVQRVCRTWGVEMVFRCAHRPSGNGIVERVHRTVKRMAARSGGDILRMVWWYNISPKSEDHTAPCDAIYSYAWRTPFAEVEERPIMSPKRGLSIGKSVFVKPPAARCTSQWSRGVITGIHPPIGVEVDGMPRHVADVRPVPDERSEASEDTDEIEEECEARPLRERRLPARLSDYVL